MTRQIIQPPDSPSDNWIGRASAEKSLMTWSNDLYRLAGLSVPQWSILGIDMWAFGHRDEPRWSVHVYAINCEKHGIHVHEDLQRLHAERGSLPVKNIRLHDVSFEDIVRSMKVIHVQLLSRNGWILDEEELGDFPLQET